MKKATICIAVFVLMGALAGCGGAQGEDTGEAYMPDMYYSRAYDAYGYNTSDRYYKNLAERGIRFNGLPVAGTMARGDVSAYPYPNTDTGYIQSAAYTRPASLSMTKEQRREAERLYLVNCAICHGTALDGNGPLWDDGEGPYPVKPRDLKDDYSKKLADGQMYHVIVHGKGQMGSYESNLKPEERWWVIQFIREKQGTGGVAQSNSDSTQVGGVPAGGAAGGAGMGTSGNGSGTGGGTSTGTNTSGTTNNN